MHLFNNPRQAATAPADHFLAATAPADHFSAATAPAAVEQFPAAAPAAFYTNPYIAPGETGCDFFRGCKSVKLRGTEFDYLLAQLLRSPFPPMHLLLPTPTPTSPLVII